MKHNKIVLGMACSVLALSIGGCKMSTEEKLAFAGLGAMHIADSVAQQKEAEEEQATATKNKETQEQQEKQAIERADAKVKGNFGLELGQVFDTKKCIAGTLEEEGCAVPLNGNTFFKEALVGYHPESKKIYTILGKTPVKNITLPQQYKGSNSTLAFKQEYMGTQMAMYMQKQYDLVLQGLKQSGVLAEDVEKTFGQELYDSPNKRILFKESIVDTNMGNQFTPNPYAKIIMILGYFDKNVEASVKEYRKNKALKAQQNKLKGNF